MNLSPAVLAALGAALLFGASTPFAKLLLGDVAPWPLAGLLYFGSGAGLWAYRLLRDRGWSSPALARTDWLWLAGAIASGGVLGPVLLMYGLLHTSAGNGSLLLNLEGVFTALIAWLVFRENADRRIVFGMALIVAGGALLTASSGDGGGNVAGPIAVSAACLCWAIDNNLTRQVSASDPVFIAASKGLIAGVTNLSLAFAIGARFPAPQPAAAAMLLGLLGYGISLVLFVLALRGLGSARTGAYFSTAPFIGALLALPLLHEHTSATFWLAAAMMAIGVWLHLTENHEHVHTHEMLMHTHPHRHDDPHHQHTHEHWDGQEPHTHEHRHRRITHSHPHFPDLHHRHSHSH